jgi:uncharacterized protein
MTEGLTIDVCGRCGHAVHPPRLLCPVCGAREWRAQRAGGGTVEELTEVAATGARLAVVVTDLGPRVIARAAHGVRPGCRVVLSAPGGAVSAEPEG